MTFFASDHVQVSVLIQVQDLNQIKLDPLRTAQFSLLPRRLRERISDTLQPHDAGLWGSGVLAREHQIDLAVQVKISTANGLGCSNLLRIEFDDLGRPALLVISLGDDNIRGL